MDEHELFKFKSPRSWLFTRKISLNAISHFQLWSIRSAPFFIQSFLNKKVLEQKHIISSANQFTLGFIYAFRRNPSDQHVIPSQLMLTSMENVILSRIRRYTLRAWKVHLNNVNSGTFWKYRHNWRYIAYLHTPLDNLRRWHLCKAYWTLSSHQFEDYWVYSPTLYPGYFSGSTFNNKSSELFPDKEIDVICRYICDESGLKLENVFPWFLRFRS